MRLAGIIVLLMLSGAALVGPPLAPQLQALWQKLKPAAGALVMSGVSIGLGVAIAVGLGVAFIGWPK